MKLCKHYGDPSFFYFRFLFLEHLQTSSDIEGLRFQTKLFPFTNVLWIFYVQWHHVSFLKINIVLIGYSSIDLQRAATLIGWFIIGLMNIQLCTLRHTLMATISNPELSGSLIYLSKQLWIITCEFSHCLGKRLLICLFVLFKVLQRIFILTAAIIKPGQFT